MVERRDLPLFAWSETAKKARVRRRALQRSRGRYGAICLFGCLSLGAPSIAPPVPRLVWNVSASAPPGLYRVAPESRLRRGDMVIARTPLSVRALAASRRYIPANVPLVKRIAAVPGDRICAAGATITVNGRRLVTRRARDRYGRPLPWWTGCRTLPAGTLLLVMASQPDSFDGRYFGPTSGVDVIGKATALWLV